MEGKMTSRLISVSSRLDTYKYSKILNPLLAGVHTIYSQQLNIEPAL
jgi:hypothetical protein